MRGKTKTVYSLPAQEERGHRASRVLYSCLQDKEDRKDGRGSERYKETKGLERGAVDKLLVEIFVFC